MPRLIVRTRPAHGDARRYRAGLGPLGREPVVVEASEAQARELMADPVLLVAQAGDEAKTSPDMPPGDGMSRKRVRKAKEAF